MKALKEEVPQKGLKLHSMYSESFKMYVVVGQSASLTFTMDKALDDEIARGLWWFMLSLLGGVAFCFVLFSWIFERRLHVRVTTPIMELSRQIKNPKEFMAARNKLSRFSDGNQPPGRA